MGAENSGDRPSRNSAAQSLSICYIALVLASCATARQPSEFVTPLAMLTSDVRFMNAPRLGVRGENLKRKCVEGTPDHDIAKFTACVEQRVQEAPSVGFRVRKRGADLVWENVRVEADQTVVVTSTTPLQVLEETERFVRFSIPGALLTDLPPPLPKPKHQQPKPPATREFLVGALDADTVVLATAEDEVVLRAIGPDLRRPTLACADLLWPDDAADPAQLAVENDKLRALVFDTVKGQFRPVTPPGLAEAVQRLGGARLACDPECVARAARRLGVDYLIVRTADFAEAQSHVLIIRTFDARTVYPLTHLSWDADASKRARLDGARQDELMQTLRGWLSHFSHDSSMWRFERRGDRWSRGGEDPRRLPDDLVHALLRHEGPFADTRIARASWGQIEGLASAQVDNTMLHFVLSSAGNLFRADLAVDALRWEELPFEAGPHPKSDERHGRNRLVHYRGKLLALRDDRTVLRTDVKGLSPDVASTWQVSTVPAMKDEALLELQSDGDALFAVGTNCIYRSVDAVAWQAVGPCGGKSWRPRFSVGPGWHWRLVTGERQDKALLLDSQDGVTWTTARELGYPLYGDYGRTSDGPSLVASPNSVTLILDDRVERRERGGPWVTALRTDAPFELRTMNPSGSISLDFGQEEELTTADGGATWLRLGLSPEERLAAVIPFGKLAETLVITDTGTLAILPAKPTTLQ